MAERALFGGRPILEFREQHDRRTFLKWAGLLGAGASMVAGGVLAVPTRAEAAELSAATPATGDIDILNYALVFEYLERDFYATALSRGLLSGRDLELIETIASHEKQHIAAVTETIKGLGGKPISKPKFTYPADSWLSRAGLLKNASTLEEIGVTAYQGQIAMIKSDDVLAQAAAIAGVESRHASIIAMLVAGPAFPAPIEQHRSKAEVLGIIKPLLS